MADRFLTLLTSILVLAFITNDGMAKAPSSEGVISRYQKASGGASVSVTGLDTTDVKVGETLEFMRETFPMHGTEKIMVLTGRGRVRSIGEGIVLAEVIEESSSEAEHYFRKFPFVMAGDQARVYRPVVQPRQYITKENLHFYFDIFVNPAKDAVSYELSAKGKTDLISSVEGLLEAGEGTIMVEGHTDNRGPSAQNQIESYNRAFAVRQFLVEALQLDSERVVAVGFGETQLPDYNNVPGHKRQHRRVVLKLVPPPYARL
jgi:outer membrane protein OmpA-like peptidoglycan-associated protein